MSSRLSDRSLRRPARPVADLGAGPAAGAIVSVVSEPAAIFDQGLRLLCANDGFVVAFAPEGLGGDLRLPGGADSLVRLRAVLAMRDTAEIEVDGGVRPGRRMRLRAARINRADESVGDFLLTVQDTSPTGAAAAPSEVWASVSFPTVSAATHELRQPLQAMTLLSSLLARRVTDPAVLPLLNRLEETVGVMSGMLTDWLDAHRGHSGLVRTAPARYPVDECLARLDQEFTAAMRRAGTRFRVMPSGATIHSDPRLLGQILRTMLQAALDHGHGGRVLLGTRRRGGRLRIEIWAGGLVPHHPDAAPVPGIAIVRRIADLLGHRIDVAMRPGQGSFFSVEVPLVTAPTQIAPMMPARLAEVPPVERPATAEGAIFVVDDDPAVSQALSELLTGSGWVCERFISSEDFLKADRPDRSGCVLVDARLPGMSGLELLRLLKPQRHRLAAIMLTGAGDVRMAVEAMAAGALNFIEKPVRYDELRPSIERAFDVLADAGKLTQWRQQAQNRAASLTARQRQILDMVLAGQPSRNIATNLGVSRRTVENHRAIIMKKMGAASIPQLIRAGIDAG